MNVFIKKALNEDRLNLHFEKHKGSRKAFVKAVLFDVIKSESETIKKNNYNMINLMTTIREGAGIWYDHKRNNNNKDS